jgi:hypothetical protein
MDGFKTLKHGQRVEFSLYYGPKGLTASYLKQILDEDDEPKTEDGVTDSSSTPPLSLI